MDPIGCKHTNMIRNPAAHVFCCRKILFTHPHLQNQRIGNFIITRYLGQGSLNGTHFCGGESNKQQGYGNVEGFPEKNTLQYTNIAIENLMFPGNYHQNCGFSMAMLVYRSVVHCLGWCHIMTLFFLVVISNIIHVLS